MRSFPDFLNLGAKMKKTVNFVSLDKETRTYLCTAEAAHHLNRSPQTLRLWACTETGPIQPMRIYGRLAWAVADIRRLHTSPRINQSIFASAGMV